VKRIVLLLVSLAAIGLVISACGAAGTQAVDSAQISPADTAAPTPVEGVGQMSSVPTAQTPRADQTAALIPTETAPVKAELEATDPAGVTLASGQVQLVEFFAYW
jgi:hypothetical protein